MSQQLRFFKKRVDAPRPSNLNFSGGSDSPQSSPPSPNGQKNSYPIESQFHQVAGDSESSDSTWDMYIPPHRRSAPAATIPPYIPPSTSGSSAANQIAVPSPSLVKRISPYCSVPWENLMVHQKVYLRAPHHLLLIEFWAKDPLLRSRNKVFLPLIDKTFCSIRRPLHFKLQPHPIIQVYKDLNQRAKILGTIWYWRQLLCDEGWASCMDLAPGQVITHYPRGGFHFRIVKTNRSCAPPGSWPAFRQHNASVQRHLLARVPTAQDPRPPSNFFTLEQTVEAYGLPDSVSRLELLNAFRDPTRFDVDLIGFREVQLSKIKVSQAPTN